MVSHLRIGDLRPWGVVVCVHHVGLIGAFGPLRGAAVALFVIVVVVPTVEVGRAFALVGSAVLSMMSII
jgi:hypothetical protein